MHGQKTFMLGTAAIGTSSFADDLQRNQLTHPKGPPDKTRPKGRWEPMPPDGTLTMIHHP
jgi:hypothetical protein